MLNFLLGFGIGVWLTIICWVIDECVFWQLFKKRKPHKVEGILKQNHHDYYG